MQAVPQAAETTVQILVPVYNEGENARELYKGLIRDGVSFDSLTFVYDLDSDTTLPVIASINKNDERVAALKNTKGRGVVNALSFAFSKAQRGPLIVVMGDNSDKLDIIPQMIRLWEGGASIVSPSRYMKGGEQHGGGVVKSGLSRLAGKTLKLLGFPTADPTNNFKLYDGTWLSEQTIESRGGFEIALELCYKAYRDNKKIVELPTVWRDRTEGESKFQFRKWLPHYLRWFMKAVGLCVKKLFI